MRSFFIIGSIVFFLTRIGVCYANSPISGEIAFDGRSYLAPKASAHTDLYSVSARIGAELGPGLRGDGYVVRYDGKVLAQEAVLEKDLGSGRLRAGVVRIPFGLYDTRETYASGLISYPIARNDYEVNGVDWGAPGAYWSGGSPHLQVEAAAFSGIGSGIENNRNFVGGGAARLQTYSGDLIIGISRWDGYLSGTTAFSDREVARMTGVDWRYTRPHLLLRGEYLAGKFADDKPHGWYADLYYRLPSYEKWTLVGRVEQSHPADDTPTRKRITAGVKCVVASDWIAALNWTRTESARPALNKLQMPKATTLDELTMQIYHKVFF